MGENKSKVEPAVTENGVVLKKMSRKGEDVSIDVEIKNGKQAFFVYIYLICEIVAELDNKSFSTTWLEAVY